MILRGDLNFFGKEQGKDVKIFHNRKGVANFYL